MLVMKILMPVAITLMLAPAAQAKKTKCHSTACEIRVAKKQCSQKRVKPCIKRAALHHRQPYRDMLRVAMCESSFNPYNSYVGHYGLYQYLPSTWATTPYRHHSIWSAKWQALATAWMWSQGRRNQWACH